MLLECKVWVPHPLMYACRIGKLPMLHTAQFKLRVLSVEACSSCLLLPCHECKLRILIKLIMPAVASLHGGESSDGVVHRRHAQSISTSCCVGVVAAGVTQRQQKRPCVGSFIV